MPASYLCSDKTPKAKRLKEEEASFGSQIRFQPIATRSWCLEPAMRQTITAEEPTVAYLL